METSIRIKMAGIEIEYSGAEDYLREQLPQLIEQLVNLQLEFGTDFQSEGEGELPPPDSSPPEKQLQMTCNNIATKLGVKTCTDLAVAAAASLVLVKGSKSFSRSDLLAEMKAATSHYKKNHSSNLGKSIQSLLKGNRFNEPKANHYALTLNERSRLESALAG